MVFHLIPKLKCSKKTSADTTKINLVFLKAERKNNVNFDPKKR